MSINIPQLVLPDPQANKALVDALEALKRGIEGILVVDEAPTDPTEVPLLAYCRADKKIYVSDTDELRTITTEAI